MLRTQPDLNHTALVESHWQNKCKLFSSAKPHREQETSSKFEMLFILTLEMGKASDAGQNGLGNRMKGKERRTGQIPMLHPVK